MDNKTKKTVILVFWSLFGVAFLSVLGLFLYVWNNAEIPDMASLESQRPSYASKVVAADGRTVLTSYFRSSADGGNRTYVSYNDMAPNLIDALVSTEDIRFRRHSGIDFQALMRVGFKTLLMMDKGQGGGSTITQQLAKQRYKRSASNIVVNKLKEWIIAVKLERMYTKEEIIEMYLNIVPFGSNTSGIYNASKTFFGKEPADLLPEESAVLIGMLSANTDYNPKVHPEAAKARRNLVLDRMVVAGKLNETLADSLKAVDINLENFRIINEKTSLAPYFRDMLFKEMNATEPVRKNYRYIEEYQRDSLRWENNDFYGWLNKNRKPDGSKYDIYTDGLRIITTLDARMQAYAEESVAEFLGGELQPKFHKEQRHLRNAPFAAEVTRDQIVSSMANARRWSDRTRVMKKRGASDREIEASFDVPTQMSLFCWKKDPKTGKWGAGSVDTLMTPNDSIRYYKGFLRAAFMAIEPNTGHIKAYVGGPNFSHFQYDNVRQGARQVGSTIKPFLYTLAMQGGMTPCTEVVNVPQTFIIGDNTWTPRSTDREESIGKTVTLKWGLTNSSNNISAYLMKQFGPEAMVGMMHKMGISSHLDPVPALCVGPADLSVYEMVAAYNTFPSQGRYPDPIFVTRIEDNDGNVLATFHNSSKEVIDAKTAHLMVNLMQGVVSGGTAMRLISSNYYGLKGQIAGKTGTTNNNTDGWFIGYTPTITAGVWVGGEDKTVHPSMSLGQGAHSALPIWGIWMKKVLADGRLGISESDTFTVPGDFHVDMGCTGGDSDAHNSEETTEEDFFN